MATSRDAKELRDVWEGWHTIAPPMRKDYVALRRARRTRARGSSGFADTGAMWRSKYDMPPDDVRRTSSTGSGSRCGRSTCRSTPTCAGSCARSTATSCPATGPIPAHLLGNMWAQDVGQHLPARRAARTPTRAIDLTDDPEEPQDRPRSRWCATASASSRRSASTPLPKTFWERSLFVKPKDRDVVCHASAWDIDFVDDLRIKMCIDITAEDFTTIHHELGHNFYQRAYNKQPVLFRDSANDGFHEAIGDTIALSVTPEYLVQHRPARQGARHVEGHRPAARQGAREGRVPAVRPADRPVALEGLLRRDHAGRVQQGVVGAAAEVPGRRAAVAARRGRLRSAARSTTSPANAPYTRYFLADILQFQFHRALAKTAGCNGAAQPLLDLREQGRRAEAERRCWRWAARSPGPTRSRRSPGSADGRDRDPRLLRAAAEVARRAEQGQAGRLVALIGAVGAGLSPPAPAAIQNETPPPGVQVTETRFRTADRGAANPGADSYRIDGKGARPDGDRRPDR